MQSKFLLVRLGCAAIILMSPLFAFAGPDDPIADIHVGLGHDPGSTLVATTKTDADGKFAFMGLQTGKYYLVVLSASDPNAPMTKVGPGTLILNDSQAAKGSDSDTSPRLVARYSGPGNGNFYFGKQATVVDGAQLKFERTFTITPVNDAPTISLRVDPNTGRSSQSITIGMDGGAISGSFKTAENESPLPQDRKAIDSPMPKIPGVPFTPQVDQRLGSGGNPATKIRLEWDDGRSVATTESDAAGKFEFKNLKAGSYLFVIVRPDQDPQITKVGPGTVVLPAKKYSESWKEDAIKSIRVENSSYAIDPESGRSKQTIVVTGGTISGELKFADNNSPMPTKRATIAAPMPVVPDAPSGVVNFILKKDFEGIQLGVQVREQPKGLLIQQVNEGSLAQQLGILPKDLIVSVNGVPTTTVETLRTQLNAVGAALKSQNQGFAILSDLETKTKTETKTAGPTLIIVDRGGRILGVRAAGNVRVAAGDINGDGIIVGADAGAGPVVSKVTTKNSSNPEPNSRAAGPKPAKLDIIVMPVQNPEATAPADPAAKVNDPKAVAGEPAGAKADPNGAWRFKQLPNGKWLYYGLDEKWMVNENGKWVPYLPTSTTGGVGPSKTIDRMGNPTVNVALEAAPKPGGSSQPNGIGNKIGAGFPALSPQGEAPTAAPRKSAAAGAIGGAVRGAFGGKK
ncbi:MAG: PDZ domain-containing protein [Planctomycetia bacterium]|nr:PDZ domain-containing protein [Planctomycetia bacterium]